MLRYKCNPVYGTLPIAACSTVVPIAFMCLWVLIGVVSLGALPLTLLRLFGGCSAGSLPHRELLYWLTTITTTTTTTTIDRKQIC